MKRASIKLDIVTPILANYAGTNKKNRFPRDNANKIIFQQSWWHSALTAAISMSNARGIKPGDICVSPILDVRTEMYNRPYGDRSVREHESIPANATLVVDAVVSDHITESGLTAIFEFMGKFIGLSPFGHKLGFGRFNVEEIRVYEQENSE